MTVTKITTAWLNKRAYITEDTNNTNIGFFNFVTYEILYAVVSVMTFIDLLTLLLRIASIRERRSRPQADDYSAILACVFSIATGIIVLYGAVKRVTGRHDWDPWPPPEGPWPRSDYTMSTKDTDHPVFLDLYKIHLQVNYALNSLQGVGIGTVRLAFLFLFKKLFTHQGRGYMILVNVLIGFVTLFMLAYTAVSVFVCGAHPEAQWTNHDTAAEHCLVLPTYNFGIGIVTVVLDTAVFFLPMYPLYRITSTMTREKKCYILIVFCFGFLAVISSFFSLIIGTPAFLFQGQSYLYTWLRDHGAGDGDTFGWSGTTTFWSYMELAVGAAVCNLPIISRFLIHRLWDVSKQATVQTIQQAIPRSRKLFAHNHTPESFDLQSDTLPIYTARSQSSHTATMGGSEHVVVVEQGVHQKLDGRSNEHHDENTGCGQSQETPKSQSQTVVSGL